jgi:hypothetical protein
MFILKYKLKESALGERIFLLTEIKQTHGEGILISTESKEATGIIINKEPHRLKMGEALLNTDSIKNGEIAPKFITGTTLCPATPFIKSENSIRWAALSWEYAPAALDAFLKLEEIILGFRDELLSIKEAVSGKKLLTFADEQLTNDRKETQ